MAQHTQPLISQQLPPATPHSNVLLQQQQQPQQTNATNSNHNHNNNNNNNNNNLNNNNNNNNNTNNNHNSNGINTTANNNNNNNNSNLINNNNNTQQQQQQHSVYGSGGNTTVVSTTQPLTAAYPPHTGVYMNPATVHAPHAPMFSTMIPTHMGNGVYVNNVPGNVNIPTAGGWTHAVPTYMHSGAYTELHTDATGAIIQSMPGLQTLPPSGGMSSTPPSQQQPQLPQQQPQHAQQQGMNVRGMRRRGRGGAPRHTRDYNNQQRPHQMQHTNSAVTTSADVGTLQDHTMAHTAQQAMDCTQTIMGGAPGTGAHTQYATHTQYAPAAAYQLAYPAYFTTQNAMLHPATHSAVTGQPNASGTPMYVSSVPIYNTQQLYNYGYIYPSVVNPEYQFLAAGEEVQAVAIDGRQSADVVAAAGGAGGVGVSVGVGGLMPHQQQLWHPAGMYADEYAVNADMSAVPVSVVPVAVATAAAADDYQHNSAIGSAETLSPNYAIYETQQIPELTQQIASMQMYDEAQQQHHQHQQQQLVNNAGPVVQLAGDNILVECDAMSPTAQSLDAMPVGNCINMSNDIAINDNTNAALVQQQSDYIIDNQTQIQLIKSAAVVSVDADEQQHLIENYNNNNAYGNEDAYETVTAEQAQQITFTPATKTRATTTTTTTADKEIETVHKIAAAPQIYDNASAAKMIEHEELLYAPATKATASHVLQQTIANDVPKPEMIAMEVTQNAAAKPSMSQVVAAAAAPAPAPSTAAATTATVAVTASNANYTSSAKQQQQQRNTTNASHTKYTTSHGEQRKLSANQNNANAAAPAHHHHHQPIRRKHSAADQNVSAGGAGGASIGGGPAASANSGSDKFMQTTKSMSWTNSSQHKKSTTSVAVTATPGGAAGAGRKHSNAGQTQQHTSYANKNSTSSNTTTSTHGSNNATPTQTPRNQSAMKTSSTSPTVATVSASTQASASSMGQRAEKPKYKANATTSTIATSTASTSVAPNQFAQHTATLQSQEVTANTHGNSTEQPTATVAATANKQYPGFEQKKAIPRTTSPTANATSTAIATATPSTYNTETANETTAALSVATAATMPVTGVHDTSASPTATFDAATNAAHDTNVPLAAPAPQIVPNPAAAATNNAMHVAAAPAASAGASKPATTSWASLFSSGNQPAANTQISTSAQAPAAVAYNNAASKPAFAATVSLPPVTTNANTKKSLLSNKSSLPSTAPTTTTAAPITNYDNKMQATSSTTSGGINPAPAVNATTSTAITPGPMSYSAASAQGLAAAPSHSNSSSTASAVLSNNTQNSVTRPPQKLDEWTTKYAEFLTKQKTDLNPISLRPRGLTNRSNYCYINSILQALLGCSPFYNLMRAIPKQVAALSSVKTPTINAMMSFMANFSTMPAGQRLRTNHRRGHKGANKDDIGTELQCDSAFEPMEIYKLWNESRKEEGEGRQEDAEEFLGYVLNKLNDEMEEIINLIAKPKPEQNGQSGEQSEGEDGDQWQMICNYRNRSSITRQNDYRSTPLSDIFRGELRSRLVREGEHSTDVIQPFYTLQLNIENVTSVKEALEVLSGRDQLEGVTGSKTKQEVQAWQQMTIEKLPIILILHLKYFDYRQDGLNKILKKVDFPVELKIDPKIMGTKKYPQRQRTYRLIAVVYHDGKEASKGHYIADVYHTGYSSWLRYDDNSVKPVSENHVLVPRTPRVPYLLYYRRCDTMPQQQAATQSQQQNNHNNNMPNTSAHAHGGGDHRARH